jgi:hypothetical protein
MQLIIVKTLRNYGKIDKNYKNIKNGKNIKMVDA